MASVVTAPVGAQVVRRGTAPPVRTVRMTPALRIGDETDDNTLFRRIVGATRLPGAEVVVLDGASQEIRVFGPTGTFERRLSRRGAGPGELENAGARFRIRDSVFASEQPPGPSRYSRYTLRDGFIRREPLSATNARTGLRALARLAVGDLLVEPGGFRPIVPPALGVVQRDSTRIGILHLGERGLVMWLGSGPSVSWISYPLSEGPVRVGMSRHSLGPTFVVGASADLVWVGDSGTDSITRFDATGAK